MHAVSINQTADILHFNDKKQKEALTQLGSLIINRK